MDNLDSTNNKVIFIKKASGDEEPFSTDKLKRSLLNAGAKNETIQKIVLDIENWIYPGITTRKIYSRAFKMLRHEKSTSSLRYSLKKAILELGPTGYPFEILIGKLFQHMGFKTEVGIVIEGSCVSHEMDVIATHDIVQHLVECKYHTDQGKQVGVQVPLYVCSRVNDIVSKRKGMLEYKDFTFTGWVVTNTRFSSDSIQYGVCNGLNLLAWNYPTGNGLQESIEKFKIYPITVLKNLSIKEKQYLLNEGIVTCSQLLENTDSLNYLELSRTKHNILMKELDEICF
ncbi:MAG: restriction endonuclease [Bacteroidetes bacterium]|nr:restriction endonuclease [Bacteroidota bacterium]MBU1116421.1 restriction endonuclease [Bacteroidota bacterium]MBU1800000.1 restriction endonuclease [Bacteroidota bacterium]